MKEIEKVIEQKSLIKNQQSTNSSVVSSANDSSNNSTQSAQNKAEPTGEADAESKSWTTAGSVSNEALDETIINKNSFCIIVGSYIRRNAVSPKTVNIYEFQMLLSSYKAMFEYLGSPKNTREGESLITKAFEHKGSISTDIINFKEEINVSAVAQHLGMLTHLRAWTYVRLNAMHKCMKTLWIDEKDAA